MTFAGWVDDDRGMHKQFEFIDFSSAWDFMSRVAALAEALDHHPDWSNSWNKVSITLISHDSGKVTERDTKMAEAINEIFLKCCGRKS